MEPSEYANEVDKYLKELEAYKTNHREIAAHIPAYRRAVAQAAHTTALALEVGMLSPESIQEIRDALAFADTYELDKTGEGDTTQ